MVLVAAVTGYGVSSLGQHVIAAVLLSGSHADNVIEIYEYFSLKTTNDHLMEVLEENVWHLQNAPYLVSSFL